MVRWRGRPLTWASGVDRASMACGKRLRPSRCIGSRTGQQKTGAYRGVRWLLALTGAARNPAPPRHPFRRDSLTDRSRVIAQDTAKPDTGYPCGGPNDASSAVGRSTELALSARSAEVSCSMPSATLGSATRSAWYRIRDPQASQQGCQRYLVAIRQPQTPGITCSPVSGTQRSARVSCTLREGLPA